MRAVARLVHSYFAGTPLARALTLGGLALNVASLLVLAYLPQIEHSLAFAMLGQLTIFLGSCLMPWMVGRLARGHALQLVPRGRLKLLASIYLTMALVALPAGLLSPLVLASGVGARLPDILENPNAAAYFINLGFVTYTSLVLTSGWLYLIMWFLTTQRNLAGVAKALIVIALVMIVPAREIRELDATIEWNLVQLAIVWTVFGAGFMYWPRLRAKLARRPVRREKAAAASRDTWGREVQLMLGTSNPWQLVAAMAVPILLATRPGMRAPEIWLFMLTIFSTVMGSIAGQAATRSRALWLRRGVTRVELFAEVERAFWRHNGIVLAVLLVLMAGMGSYMHLPGELLAAGLPLLVLGSTLSTSLGLMVTRGLRWTEIVAASAVMLTLMIVALLVGTMRVTLPVIFAIETVLAAVVLVLRAVARRRWTHIDWIECRPARELVTRGT